MAGIQSTEQFVLQSIRDIIHSGEILSLETGQPLSDGEKAQYMMRATFYFIREETKWRRSIPAGNNAVAPVYDVFMHLLRLEGRYSATLICTVETICRIPTRDEEEFQNYIAQLRREVLLEGNERPANGAHAQNLNELSVVKKIWGHIQDNAWGYLSCALAADNAKAVVSSVLDEIVLSLEGTVKPYSVASGVRCSVMVSGFYLAGVMGYNVYQAARGRRSWRRVGKNMVEETASVAAGAVVGVAVAVALAPFTGGLSLLCGALIGLTANICTRTLAKKYTGQMFNIPEDEMLEKAYITLGVHQLTKNDEVSKAYRQKSRLYHPDKVNVQCPNASEDEKNKYLWQYLKVQTAFAMISAARREDVVDYDNARRHFKRIVQDELVRGKHIDITLKLWVLNIVQKLWAFVAKSKESLKYPAITNGYLPFEVFEDDEVQEAIALSTE